MARMIGQQPFHAVTFAGRRYDCGNKTGFVEATLALALERPDMADEVRRDGDAAAGGLNPPNVTLGSHQDGRVSAGRASAADDRRGGTNPTIRKSGRAGWQVGDV